MLLALVSTMDYHHQFAAATQRPNDKGIRFLLVHVHADILF